MNTSEEIPSSFHIPIQKLEILEKAPIPQTEKVKFSIFYHKIEAYLHHHYHQKIKTIDSEYQRYHQTHDHFRSDETNILGLFHDIVTSANYSEVKNEDLKKAFKEKTGIAIDIKIDLQEYDFYRIYYQQKLKKRESITKLFFLKKEIDFALYDKVVIIAKHISDNQIYLKLFENIPSPDLEMIFPAPKIIMKFRDKVKIFFLSVLGLSIVIWRAIQVQDDLFSGRFFFFTFFGLFSYIFKIINSYKTTVVKYVKSFTTSLYFKLACSGENVYRNIISSAEEEDLKEVFLGFVFLTNFPSNSIDELDKRIEDWALHHFNVNVDFDIIGSFNKLENWGLICKKNNNITALDVNQAIDIIDEKLKLLLGI